MNGLCSLWKVSLDERDSKYSKKSCHWERYGQRIPDFSLHKTNPFGYLNHIFNIHNYETIFSIQTNDWR